MRKEIDLHGHYLDEAINQVHLIVGQVRMTEQPEDWCFITGSGVLQSAVIKELESYGLKTHVPAENLGVIHVNIE